VFDPESLEFRLRWTIEPLAAPIGEGAESPGCEERFGGGNKVMLQDMRSLEKGTDLDFSAAGPAKSRGTPNRRNLVRILVYTYAIFALLSASWDLNYVARLRGLLDWRNSYGLAFESLSVVGFWGGILVFPVAISLAANWAGLESAEWRWAVASMLALLVFQLFAILPLVQ
jgi:hypothetical protein